MKQKIRRSILMTTVTEDRGRLNLYAKEPPMEIIDVYETHNEKAEKLNGRLAMLGVMAALGAYAITGQIIPVSGNGTKVKAPVREERKVERK